ncbi:MAG: LppX_LprAFG lipoprotein [Dermatophilaceae bacterium]
MPHRRVLLLAVPAVVAALVAGCSGEGASETPERDPAQRLAAAKTAFDGAGSVKIDLTSTDVPKLQSGVTAAKGSGVISATEPKFAGSITGTIDGVAGQVEVVAIGETAWIKFFTPDFVETDLDTLNAPNPATFVHPERGISSLLPRTVDPTEGSRVRAGREVLDQVAGTLPGAAVADLLNLGDGTGTYRITYGLTAEDELRTATLVGPFFEGAEATYTLTLTDYGTSVAIARP